VPPAADGAGVDRLAHLEAAGRLDRALGLVGLEAAGVPRQAAEVHQPAAHRLGLLLLHPVAAAIEEERREG